VKSPRSGIRPLRRFSQNFLVDPGPAKRLAESLGIAPGDTVVEIGPGEGVLTRFLLDSPAARVVGVELERRCADWLRGRFAGERRFVLIEGDFLQADLPALAPGKGRLHVAGNIPYAITSPILFRLLDHRQRVREAALTMQEEVARRVAASPGSKEYGIPSVLLQMWSDVRVLFRVPRGAFRPVPGVDSAVLHAAFRTDPRAVIEDEAFFRRTVRTLFGQRRKMIRNTVRALAPGLPENVLPDGLLRKRPEELTPEALADLSNRIRPWAG
jgi:16S rRNA (adenine1518-N6/adenine1519-N6)-dimethyltransferase